MIVEQRFSKRIARVLQGGGVGVIPTDTIYGLVGSALDKKAVLRIYKLRNRDLKKPFIVLLQSPRDLFAFGIHPNAKERAFLNQAWPGSVSIVLPAPSKKFNYLHRGKRSLAFRVPPVGQLREFLKKTGPLVAPSANIAGKPPAVTVGEAKKYFGERVDFYVDGGKISGKPSTLITFDRKGNVKVLRRGAVKV